MSLQADQRDARSSTRSSRIIWRKGKALGSLGDAADRLPMADRAGAYLLLGRDAGAKQWRVVVVMVASIAAIVVTVVAGLVAQPTSPANTATPTLQEPPVCGLVSAETNRQVLSPNIELATERGSHVAFVT
jgi:hypothetical protein